MRCYNLAFSIFEKSWTKLKMYLTVTCFIVFLTCVFLSQVFAGGWTAVYASLDNVGVWNLRSDNLDLWYLGQETYMRIVNPEDTSNKTELPVPDNALYCGALSSKQKYCSITFLPNLPYYSLSLSIILNCCCAFSICRPQKTSSAAIIHGCSKPYFALLAVLLSAAISILWWTLLPVGGNYRKRIGEFTVLWGRILNQFFHLSSNIFYTDSCRG